MFTSYDVTKKMLSRDSNYVSFSICLRVILTYDSAITSIL